MSTSPIPLEPPVHLAVVPPPPLDCEKAWFAVAERLGAIEHGKTPWQQHTDRTLRTVLVEQQEIRLGRVVWPQLAVLASAFLGAGTFAAAIVLYLVRLH